MADDEITFEFQKEIFMSFAQIVLSTLNCFYGLCVDKVVIKVLEGSEVMVLYKVFYKL